MRLQELFETTEEDRALISLSSAIYNKIKPYAGGDESFVYLGKIGKLFDTSIPALNDISIGVEGGNKFMNHSVGYDDTINIEGQQTYAFWDEDDRLIVFNKDLLDTNRMKTTITHELRHVLDSVKSNFYPGDAKTYFTPKKKEHRKNDPYSAVQYMAQPAEINARFVEILDILSKRIPQWYNKLPSEQIKHQLSTDFKNLLNKYEIADLFPEKTKSPDYKRLYKRAYDFMQKEMTHVESELEKEGISKHAVGNW